jgi:phosphatidylglycerophosphatase C
MKRAVALFDFDNTIAQGDSIKRLLIYDLKKRPYHCFYFFQVAFFYIGYILHLCSFEKAKTALLFPLRSMDEEELKLFYKTYVAPYCYPHMLAEMKKRQQEGCLVIVCTASVEGYMQYHDLPADCLLGTRVKGDKVIGKNCKGLEKIQRILQYLEQLDCEIDYEHSYGYSDSNDDIPMLSLVKYQKRVLLKSGKIVDFKV